jgi:hypothetical protein
MKDHGSESIYLDTSLHILTYSHSFRFEHKLGPRLKVTALIDPSVARSEKVLEGKRASFVLSAYEGTKTYKTIEDYYQDLQAGGSPKPQ